jgi:hypothetical protein
MTKNLGTKITKIWELLFPDYYNKNSGTKSYKNLGTKLQKSRNKVIKIWEQKSKNKNLGTKIWEQRIQNSENKNYKNLGTKI